MCGDFKEKSAGILKYSAVIPFRELLPAFFDAESVHS